MLQNHYTHQQSPPDHTTTAVLDKKTFGIILLKIFLGKLIINNFNNNHCYTINRNKSQ